ncbi:MAG TPA: phage GP46 family protein [Pseudomonas sp.]|uniref:phage GP46 family protein n=1 Tax=Pseudomonas sp. TaxID=306 RepID=UPI002CF14DE0|nr:phage GP46 family protein [Pseudomonas sp.]HWH86363.1 phage GP46 family protein [Pseudomonas sp.]
MSDVTLVWGTEGGDLGYENGDLVLETGLLSSALVSLYTHRRARKDDVLPGDATDLRGWWADVYTEVPGDQIGSRFWLLSREKQLPEVLRRAQDYAQEALRWMLEDGVAAKVETVASVPETGVLRLQITIYHHNGSVESGQYDSLWEIH